MKKHIKQISKFLDIPLCLYFCGSIISILLIIFFTKIKNMEVVTYIQLFIILMSYAYFTYLIADILSTPFQKICPAKIKKMKQDMTKNINTIKFLSEQSNDHIQNGLMFISTLFIGFISIFFNEKKEFLPLLLITLIFIVLLFEIYFRFNFKRLLLQLDYKKQGGGEIKNEIDLTSNRLMLQITFLKYNKPVNVLQRLWVLICILFISSLFWLNKY